MRLGGLAKATDGDFARGCVVAREAFEREDLSGGRTQLTHEAVVAATGRLNGNPVRSASSVGVQSVAGASPVSHAASPHSFTAVPTAPSLRVTQPVAPLSPVASNPASPIMKVEAELPTGQPGVSGGDSEISSSQEEYQHASTVRMMQLLVSEQQIKLDMALQKQADAAHRRLRKERNAARLRLHGDSAEDALEL